GNTPLKEVSAIYDKFNKIIGIEQTRIAFPQIKVDKSEELKLLEEALYFFEKALEGIASKNKVSDQEKEKEVEGIRVIIKVSGEYGQPTSSENKFVVNETLTFTGESLQSQLKQTQVPTLPAIMVNPFSHRTSNLTSSLWSEVVEADLKDETIQLLQHFD